MSNPFLELIEKIRPELDAARVTPEELLDGVCCFAVGIGRADLRKDANSRLSNAWKNKFNADRGASMLVFILGSNAVLEQIIRYADEIGHKGRDRNTKAAAFADAAEDVKLNASRAMITEFAVTLYPDLNWREEKTDK